MFCSNCGCKLKENAKFCPGCGMPIQRNSEEYKNESKLEENNHKRNKKSSKSIVRLVIGILVVVLVAASCSVILINKNKKIKTYNQYIQDGKYHLEEMNYEQAETDFFKAIEIDPKQKEPYIYLADVYVACEKYEKAKGILNDAIESADLEDNEKNDIEDYIADIEEKMNSSETETEETTDYAYTARDLLSQYYENELKTKYGEVEEGDKTGTYNFNYDSQEQIDHMKNIALPEGILSSFIEDMNGDGKEELHVIRNVHAVKKMYDFDETYVQMYWEIYEVDDENIVLKSQSLVLEYPVAFEETAYTIYLKDVNGQKLLYVEAYTLVMEREQTFFAYEDDGIVVKKSLYTTGGNGGIVDIYESDSEYISSVDLTSDDSAVSSNNSVHAIYKQGENQDFEAYLNGYIPKLNSELEVFGVHMQTDNIENKQYPFYGMYLADSECFDQKIFSYQLIPDMFDETQMNQDIGYSQKIENIKF